MLKSISLTLSDELACREPTSGTIWQEFHLVEYINIIYSEGSVLADPIFITLLEESPLVEFTSIIPLVAFQKPRHYYTTLLVE